MLFLILFCSAVYLTLGSILGVLLVRDSGKFESLSNDAKNVLVCGVALVWPIATLGCLGWVLRRAPRFLFSCVRAFGRGVRDLRHAALPARPPKVVLPKAVARPRRDLHHVNDNCGPNGCPPERAEHGCGVDGCTESSRRERSNVEPLGWS